MLLLYEMVGINCKSFHCLHQYTKISLAIFMNQIVIKSSTTCATLSGAIPKHFICVLLF